MAEKYMKKFNKKIIVALSFVCVLGLVGIITAFSGQTSPSLGTASTFSILAKTLVSNVPTSSISGDVGLDAAGTNYSGLTSAEVTGTIYDTNGTGPDGGAGNDPTLMTSARAANLTAYGALDAAPNVTCNVTYAGTQDLAGLSLVPGIYCADEFSLSGTLTLDDTGTPDGVWIFRSSAALNTSSGSVANVVFLTGVGLPCNVWWKVVSSATLGVGTNFIGNILAATSITMQTGATLDGRAFAYTGAVTLDSNTITGPTCSGPATLTVIKNVTNDNGGTALASAWNLAVTSSNAGTGTGSAAGTGSGTVYTLQTGKQYSVAESGGPTGYLANASSECTIPSAAASTAYTCTITNNDIAPQLTVTKVVVGGTSVIADFPLFIDGASVTSGIANESTVGLHTISETSRANYRSVISGTSCATDGTITLAIGDVKICTITNTYDAPSGGYIKVPPIIDLVKVPSPLALPAGPGSVTYTYTLRNIGTVPVINITMIDNSCTPAFVSGDTNNNTQLDLTETWIYNCSVTLQKTHTNNAVATGWANGISTTDIASATVIVGIPVVPPLIHVTKVPNPIALITSGLVTYTNKVTNPGTVALSNVRLADDKCSPVNYISGDINNNSKLDTSETWTYTCAVNLIKTTTNTITASGDANGLTAYDFAIATVVVSVPGLPQTGFPPEEKSLLNTIIPAGIFIVLFSLYIIRNKKSV